MSATERFPKVYVFDPVSSKLNTTGGIRPHQLGAKEVGFFPLDAFNIIGTNASTAMATPGAVRTLQVHQNVGDNKYGTIRTQPIVIDQVTKFYAQAASAARTNIWHIGYNGTDGSIACEKGQSLVFHTHIWSNKLSKWYNNNPGYTKNLTISTGPGVGAADQLTVATAIAAAINNSSIPSGNITTTTEMQEFVVATVINDGSGNYGVKIETNAIAPDLLNAADPIKFYEVELVTLDVQLIAPESDPTAVIPVRETQTAKSGGGFPAELAALEAESQGYDRVREVFENPRYMKLADYVIIAADGKKYDYLYLHYDYTHNSGTTGATQGSITEAYEVIFAAPTGTLQPVADLLNSWLDGRLPAVTI